MKISTKLYFSFGLVLVLLVAIALTSVYCLKQLSEKTNEISSNVWPKIVLLQKGLAGVNEIRTEGRNMLLATDRAGRERAKASLLEARAMIGSAWRELAPRLTHPDGKERMAAVLAAREQYIAAQNMLIDLVESGRRDEAIAFASGDFHSIAGDYREKVNTLMEFQGQLMDASARQAEEVATSAGWTVLILALAATALAIIASLLVTRTVTSSLKLAVGAANAMAEGDLTSRFQKQRDDELGQLMAAMQATSDKLRLVLRDVRQAADDISTTALDVSTATAEASQAGESQADATSSSASALQEVTVSINEVSSLTLDAEMSADRTTELTQQSVDVIQAATREIESMVSAVGASSEQVHGLLHSSNEIGNIANVIRDIADQTNLLALNAAIEAARAGEQGRGFAVVADEVRKLAERTATATRKIAGVIGDIQNETRETVDCMREVKPKMEAGLAKVREVACILETIAVEADQSRMRASEVAGATREQATAANDIARHVEQVAQMVEKNSVSMRNNMQGAARLEKMSRNLREQVAYFKLDG